MDDFEAEAVMSSGHRKRVIRSECLLNSSLGPIEELGAVLACLKPPDRVFRPLSQPQKIENPAKSLILGFW